MVQMTRRERIVAALQGKPVDRPPVNFWRHFPIDDQNAESLAARTIEYRNRFDFDFIKVTPSSTYCIDDYGAKHAYKGAPIGERTYLERIIKKPEDWDRIEPLDVRRGTYGRTLRALRIVVDKKGDDTPVVQTMFNPTALAQRLVGDDAYVAHIRHYPEKLERAIKALTETCVRFAKAAIDEGADGIFLSTFAASYDVMSPAEYRKICRPGDLAVFKAAAKGWFNILHLHSQHPTFAKIADYPIQVVNWHDRTAGPSLAEAAKIFPGCLCAGVEQYSLLHFGTPAEVTAQVHDAIKQMKGRRLIVAAGCTYPLTVPEGNLIAARKAVETYKTK